MLNSSDQEQVVQSSQTANLLVQDLRELVKAKNPLLGEMAIEILEQAELLEQRLRRIESIATSTNNIA
jgi:hypothetical protein